MTRPGVQIGGLVVLAVAALLGGWTSSTQASVVVESPLLPPVGPCMSGLLTGYLGQFHAAYNTPFGQMILSNPIHAQFTNVTRETYGTGEREHFDSWLYGDMTSSLYTGPVAMPGPVTTQVNNYTSGQMGTFTAEIVTLDLSMTLGPYTIMIRESPTMASTGVTTITDLTPLTPPSDGPYEISSFFDVFTQLSLDGGQSWTSSSPPSGRMELQCYPEPTSLMLLVVGSLLAWRRR